ncbi:oxygenase MpaB family protein [Pseudomonas sp. QLc11A]|uniref:Oxygenase MpaB family protein n=1 Tax=Pseudomonas azerbaijanorientalis TaxID=2842350 RepID=A0ABW8W7P5_9PSED
MKPVYKKRFGLFHDPRIAEEIAALDEHKDAQRIVHLLASYEFSWDFERALELALFYTYGSVPVSTLLARTAEFEKYGQKRYDDTAILIGHFIESGWDGEFGRKALERMNKTHGHYTIPNDDFLFVLWTFIEFPIRWANEFGRRRMTAHEQRAWFNFWVQIGQRMGLVEIPQSKAEFDTFIERYEAQHLVYAQVNRRVADATVLVMENWLPGFLRSSVKPTVCCLMSEKFLKAVGYTEASSLRRIAVRGALKLVGGVRRVFALGGYPRRVLDRKERTYLQGYTIEEVQPVHLSKHQEAAQQSAEFVKQTVIAEKGR